MTSTQYLQSLVLAVMCSENQSLGNPPLYCACVISKYNLNRRVPCASKSPWHMALTHDYPRVILQSHELFK